MGHYDDCYESDYEDRRRRERERAEKAIPELIELLDSARAKLTQNSDVITHSKRIDGDIKFIKSALMGQLANA